MRASILALFLAAAAACSVPGVDFTTLDDGGTDAETDAPTEVALVVSTADVTVAEGSQATFTVSLSAPPAAAITISIDSADDNRVGVTPSSISLDSTNWNLPRTITLSGREDADTEDEAVAVAVSSSVGDASVDVTVTDNDSLTVVVTPAAGVDVTEGETASFTVHLSAQPSGPITVNVASSNPTTMTATPGTLSFGTGTWDLAQTVVVTGLDDVDTASASATVDLTATGLADTQVPVQIIDDDILGILPSTTNLGVVNEGGTTTFTVRLTQQPLSAVTVNVGTSDALVLTAGPATLAFDTVNWNVARTVTVNLPQDVDTTDETAMVQLTANGLMPRTVSASIADDDTQVILATPNPVTLTEGMNRTIDVRLAFQPATDVTLGVTSLNPALATAGPATLTFTPSNYDQLQAVTVTAPQDVDALSGMTSVRLEAVAAGLTRDVTVAVTDDDSLSIETTVPSVTLGEGGMATFGVRLTAMPAGTVTVNTSSGDTTAAAVTPAMLTFTPATYNTLQTVTVSGVADLDLANETLTVTLTASGVPNKTVDATVTDDDTQLVVASAPSLSVNEGGTGQVSVSLGFVPAGPVAVTVMSADGTAATVTPGTLNFTVANYASPQAITITGIDDPDIVDDTTTINLTAPSATAASVAVTVNDDDPLGIETNVTTTSVGEAGTATVGVRLTAQPPASVVVTVSSSDPLAATVMPSTLTFTTVDWNSFQNVTLTGVDDPDAINDSIVVSAMASGLVTRTVNVTVNDNDTQDILLTATTVTVGEASTTTFGVRLAAMPASDVTVAVASANTGKATAAPNPLTFTPANYATNQTVTVSGIADLDLTNDNVAINMSSAGLITRTVTATVTDDDTQEILASSTGPFTVTEGGGGVLVGFSLRYIPTGTTIVTITPGTGLTTTPATLSFNSGNYSSAQNVMMTAVNDADAADVTTTVTASSPGVSSVVVNVLVDDDEVLELDVTTTSLTVVEGGANTFGVRLTAQPPAATTVMVGSGDMTVATVGAATLTFSTSNWNTYQTVTVTGVQDADLANEAATITVSSTGMLSKTVGVTVTDDDVLTIVVSTGGITVNEGATGTVGVSLSHMPTAAVAVAVSSGDPSAVTVNPAMLSFTTSNWATVQNVTATAVSDGDASNETVTVTLSSASAANRTFTVGTVDDDVVITDLSPQMNADTVNGTTVTVTGQGFLTGTTASLKGQALINPTIVNATTITGRTPSWAVGEPRFADARVTRAGNTSVIPRAFYFGGWAAGSSGLSGGDIRSLVAPAGSSVLAGTRNGVYRSSDNGLNWSFAGVGLPTTGPIYALAADPLDAQRVFAGTDSGLYLTTDGGTTWSLAGLAGEAIECLEMPSGRQVMLACSGAGRVHRSLDGGVSWSVALTVSDPNAVVVGGGQNIHVASAAGVHTSNDQGVTWTLGNTGLPANPTSIALTYTGGFVVVSTFSGVYRSSSGNAWNSVQGLGAQNCNAFTNVGSDSYCATSSGNVYRSSDGGSNWSNLSTGLPASGVSGLRSIASRSVAPNDVFVGSSAWGVYKLSSVGMTWNPATTGINTYDVNDIAPHPVTAGTVFISPGGMGIWRSTNHGATWTASNGGISGTNWAVLDIAYTPGTPAIMWAGFNNQGVRKSTDSGATWATTGLSGTSVHELAVLDANTAYAASLSGVRKTIDGGATWTLVNTGITGTNVQSIVMFGTDVYVAELNNGVYRSGDGGASWQLRNTGLPNSVRQLFLDDQTDVLYAQTLTNTYRSGDGGGSWSLVTTATQSFAVDPLRPETLWFGATAQGGVRRSLTSGATTVGMSDQMPVNPDCMAIAIDSAAQTVYCSMRAKGMYRLAPQ